MTYSIAMMGPALGLAIMGFVTDNIYICIAIMTMGKYDLKYCTIQTVQYLITDLKLKCAIFSLSRACAGSYHSYYSKFYKYVVPNQSLFNQYMHLHKTTPYILPACYEL